MSEYSYETHTFELLDTGIGQAMGFQDDNAFRAHMEAERAKLDPEVRDALDAISRDLVRDALYGSLRLT